MKFCLLTPTTCLQKLATKLGIVFVVIDLSSHILEQFSGADLNVMCLWIAHVQYIKIIVTWLLGFLVMFLYLFGFLFAQVPSGNARQWSCEKFAFLSSKSCFLILILLSNAGHCVVKAVTKILSYQVYAISWWEI